jgi:hypothetical protein
MLLVHPTQSALDITDRHNLPMSNKYQLKINNKRTHWKHKKKKRKICQRYQQQKQTNEQKVRKRNQTAVSLLSSKEVPIGLGLFFGVHSTKNINEF